MSGPSTIRLRPAAVSAVCVLLLVASATSAPQDDLFPAAGIDLVNHELRVDVFSVSKAGEERLLETLVFDGRMLIERENPVEEKGIRKISFLVRRWEAVAWSGVLESLVVYRLSDGVEQPVSTITAEQVGRDFPATFTFNVVFDATADGNVIVKRHEGRPHGRGFMTVPPSGDRKTSPTIVGFERNQIEMEHPIHGRLRFKPRDCNDQSSKILATVGPKRRGTAAP